MKKAKSKTRTRTTTKSKHRTLHTEQNFHSMFMMSNIFNVRSSIHWDNLIRLIDRKFNGKRINYCYFSRPETKKKKEKERKGERKCTNETLKWSIYFTQLIRFILLYMNAVNIKAPIALMLNFAWCIILSVRIMKCSFRCSEHSSSFMVNRSLKFWHSICSIWFWH